MSKVFIQEDTLTNIANAIREKDGTTEPIAPQNMADAISNITTGAPEDKLVLLRGDCSNKFQDGRWDDTFREIGPYVRSEGITDALYLIYGSDITRFPFPLEFDEGQLNRAFEAGAQLREAPLIILNPDTITKITFSIMFYNCYRLTDIDYDYFTNMINPVKHLNIEPYVYNLFKNCHSLRKLPDLSIFNGDEPSNFGYCVWNSLAASCYALDELKNLPVISDNPYYSYNPAGSLATYCNRLKSLTFQPGAPIKLGSKCVLNLSTYVGYANAPSNILNYSDITGITEDKRVIDDATYQALKDDPDWWTTDINYSRYNHNSAVETINSLPQMDGGVLNYVATIQFEGGAGALTDGGAINTLTEEEIAVATAKNWTVSLL